MTMNPRLILVQDVSKFNFVKHYHVMCAGRKIILLTFQKELLSLNGIAQINMRIEFCLNLPKINWSFCIVNLGLFIWKKSQDYCSLTQLNQNEDVLCLLF